MSFIAQASTFPGVMCERFTGDTRVVEGSNSAHSDAHPYYERFLIGIGQTYGFSYRFAVLFP